MDINPSLEINLDKDNKVINVLALNEDAEKITYNDNYSGKDYDKVIEEIIISLIVDGYVKDDTTILLSVEGEMELEEVEDDIKSILEEKNISSNIVSQNISDNAKENASKYEISEGKATYIEEIIKENDSLTFEELKDKDISELNEIKNKQNNPEPEPQPEPQSEPEPQYQGGSGGVMNPPSDPTDRSGVWCTWNQHRPPWYEYYYSAMIDGSSARSYIMNILGVTDWDLIGSYVTITNYEPRSSYCIGNIVELTTRQTRYHYLLDSVTNEIIESSTEPVPQPILTEEEAIKKSLDYFGLKYEDCNMCSAYFSTNGEGGNFYYRYSIGILMNDGEQHVTDVNTQTGELIIIY